MSMLLYYKRNTKMIKKITLILSALWFTFSLQGQEKVWEAEKAYIYSNLLKKTSYSFSNTKTNELLILLEEKKKIKVYFFDEKTNLTNKFKIKPLPSKYKKIIGYSVYNNVYNLFFTNSNNTKFGVLQINAKQQNAIEHKLEINITDQLYIKSIVYEDTFKMLTVDDKTSLLNIYTFDKNLNYNKEQIHIIELEKNLNGNKKLSLWQKLQSSAGRNYVTELTVIDSKNPNSIETTSNYNKLYLLDNKLIFTFDGLRVNNDISKVLIATIYNKKYKATEVLQINLESLEHTFKSFQLDDEKKEFKKTNSYVYDDYLFQIASSKSKMKFIISDINTAQKIKEFNVIKQDTISFKNSKIIQEGGGFMPMLTEARIRKLEETKKYLRKISAADLGISVHKTNNRYKILLGGIRERTGSYSGSATDIASITPTYNHVLWAYNSASLTKTTYISCLFDEKFNHVAGEIPENIYDKIDNFENTLLNPKAVNIFLHQGKMHYNYYDTETESFSLYKF